MATADTSATAGTADDPPRDPEHYWPSEHAAIRKRERSIPWDAIAQTLAHGEVRHTHEPDLRLFVAATDADVRPVGVTARPATGEIVTVTWRDETEPDAVPTVTSKCDVH